MLRSNLTRNRKKIRNCKKNGKKSKNTVMASFRAKIGGIRPRKRKKYKLAFRFVPTQCGLENSKQVAKKFKAL